MNGLVDYGIIKPELTNALGAGYRAAEQERQAEQMNALRMQTLKSEQEASNFKLQELRRDSQMLEQLREKLRAHGQDLKPGQEHLFFDALIATGDPKYVSQGLEGRARLDELRRYQATMGDLFGGAFAAPTAAPAAPAAPTNRLSMTPAATDAETGVTVQPVTSAGVAVQPLNAPMNALAAPAPAAPATTGSALPSTGNPRIDSMGPAELESAIVRLSDFPKAKPLVTMLERRLEAMTKPQVVAPGGVVFQGGKAVFTAPNRPEAKPSALQEYEAAKAEGYQGTFLDYQKELKQAGRSHNPPTPAAPVAVIGPDGKPVYVSREEAISGKMTPAAAQESLPPKEIQKREANYPTATSSIKAFEAKSDSFVRDLKELRNDPGLNQITGMIYGRTPSVSREGSRAQALYDKIVAKGGFQILQDMREASKTGGALGNVSNREGQQLQAAFAAIDRRQNVEDVRAAIDRAIADVEGARTRMREAYDDTYSYKSGGGAASKPAAPNIDALLDKYK